VAWALDVGVKESEFKDLWDVELGATYIPWSKVPDNLEQLADGAFIDDESLPESVRSNYAICLLVAAPLVTVCQQKCVYCGMLHQMF